ncbi:hypothetical protein [Sphingobacterium cavernae]|uniref:hypothetical protein n=1 Tax=Sphingobacterium cavernae TaxID=2592657 RepID=UPI00122FC911|nr:hypothetical protein [Sphingobacterium cavernae]
MDRIELFEYFIFKSLKHNGALDNDLSILKSIKLLFFFSTVSEGNNDDFLLPIFGSVKAMPLGHVITDVYTAMKQNSPLSFFIFNKNGVNLKVSSVDESKFSEEIRREVDNRFELLLSLNPDILKMTAYQLVELSHKWFSWDYYFSQARRNGQLSMEIPLEVIKSERKIYKL